MGRNSCSHCNGSGSTKNDCCFKAAELKRAIGPLHVLLQLWGEGLPQKHSYAFLMKLTLAGDRDVPC